MHAHTDSRTDRQTDRYTHNCVYKHDSKLKTCMYRLVETCEHTKQQRDGCNCVWCVNVDFNLIIQLYNVFVALYGSYF